MSKKIYNQEDKGGDGFYILALIFVVWVVVTECFHGTRSAENENKAKVLNVQSALQNDGIQKR